jgi:hypothetical protein
MDHSVMQGVEVVNSLLLGEPEKTWQAPRPAAPILRMEEAPGEELPEAIEA